MPNDALYQLSDHINYVIGAKFADEVRTNEALHTFTTQHISLFMSHLFLAPKFHRYIHWTWAAIGHLFFMMFSFCFSLYEHCKISI